VLQSIGLIEKTNQTHNKKPAFRWIGIEGVHSFVRELSDERKANGLAEVMLPQMISLSPPIAPTKKNDYLQAKSSHFELPPTTATP